jgi:hypothetical protein
MYIGQRSKIRDRGELLQARRRKAPAMDVLSGAVPKTVAAYPALEQSPDGRPAGWSPGRATCAEVPARSKTVSHRRAAAAASVGRISVRHSLFHVCGSVETRSVVTVAAFAGRMVVIDPANCPGLTS